MINIIKNTVLIPALSVKLIPRKNKFIFYACLSGLLFCCISCRKESGDETVIYNNNFESADLTSITNGTTEIYNGTTVLGRYNNGYFKLQLNNLPKHHLLKINFDLYIHDSWDGNANFANNYSGPDLWEMDIDSNVFVNTTFSNLSCPIGNVCPPQSYPLTYQAVNNPRVGAVNIALPGACSLKTSPTGTSLYQIEKIIDHTKSSLSLKCLDHLIDKGATDPKCAESWSIDNLKVTAIK